MGINSWVAASGTDYAVGIIDNQQVAGDPYQSIGYSDPTHTYDGFSFWVDPNPAGKQGDLSVYSILIGYTYQGDINLDGEVNSIDHDAIYLAIGIGDEWYEGDLNGDGQVTLNEDWSTYYWWGRNAYVASGNHKL
jgi:hypothetical protein